MKNSLRYLIIFCRIGIAVGALVCGVIGATKPVFDIWGDTVSICIYIHIYINIVGIVC